ncbi:hypothetical protein NO2_0162 [Candidatus Termititenax persephonae]|uniref:Uncharacterized protein n=1 Tax=Candidatus Termititenax persephonae TaxID=2218525 RepID=A0A388TFT0_9BACT|nr:hypothetical protein NO2_0162 [Candidatus Termititenax persephonae]
MTYLVVASAKKELYQIKQFKKNLFTEVEQINRLNKHIAELFFWFLGVFERLNDCWHYRVIDRISRLKTHKRKLKYNLYTDSSQEEETRSLPEFSREIMLKVKAMNILEELSR